MVTVVKRRNDCKNTVVCQFPISCARPSGTIYIIASVPINPNPILMIVIRLLEKAAIYCPHPHLNPVLMASAALCALENLILQYTFVCLNSVQSLMLPFRCIRVYSSGLRRVGSFPLCQVLTEKHMTQAQERLNRRDRNRQMQNMSQRCVTENLKYLDPSINFLSLIWGQVMGAAVWMDGSRNISQSWSHDQL